jgi:hypothetical protein
MKRIAALVCLLLVMVLPAVAVEDGTVMYVGGTATTLKEGALGKLDAASPEELAFESSGSKLQIPFAKIDLFEYSQRVAHHLGVLPAIGVGLLKKRQRKHFVRIAFHDENNAPQVAIFEVPKKMPRTLLAILQLRAPQGCRPQAYAKCSLIN